MLTSSSVPTKVNNLADSTDNWALESEDTLLDELFIEIQREKEARKLKCEEGIHYITKFFNKINVDFEPDPEYRDNVKHIIIGLVLGQILKQKTINLFRKGKEDREYLGSYLMMKVQSYLLRTHEVSTWNDIIRGVYEYYRPKMRISTETESLIHKGVDQKKIISNDILISTVLSNQKNYKIRMGKNVIEYS